MGCGEGISELPDEGMQTVLLRTLVFICPIFTLIDNIRDHR